MVKIKFWKCVFENEVINKQDQLHGVDHAIRGKSAGTSARNEVRGQGLQTKLFHKNV